MKLQLLAMILVAIALVLPLVAVMARTWGVKRKGLATNSIVKLHETGILNLACEVAAITTRFLLVQKGTAADGFIVNIATTRPWGPVMDEPAVGDKAAVFGLGAAIGTTKMVANAAIAAGVPVYTAAGGKVNGTFGATLYMVGRSFTAAAADGDEIEVIPCFPLLNSAAL